MRAQSEVLIERGRDHRWHELSAVPLKADEAHAGAVELRGTAFVDDAMGFRVAKHRAPGRRPLREGERVSGRARRDQEYRDVALEQFAEASFEPPREGVVPISDRVTRIGARQRVHDSRRNARRIVACEFH